MVCAGRRVGLEEFHQKSVKAGLRLAVDNLVRNAVTHGRATRIVLAARQFAHTLTIIVDDNGRGLPEEEHQAVLDVVLLVGSAGTPP